MVKIVELVYDLEYRLLFNWLVIIIFNVMR